MIKLYQLPGKSTSGHLWPAVCVCFSVAVFQPKREDARCCHFFLEECEIKNILSEFLLKECRGI